VERRCHWGCGDCIKHGGSLASIGDWCHSESHEMQCQDIWTFPERQRVVSRVLEIRFG
jgi:hypothetical protein